MGQSRCSRRSAARQRVRSVRPGPPQGTHFQPSGCSQCVARDEGHCFKPFSCTRRARVQLLRYGGVLAPLASGWPQNGKYGKGHWVIDPRAKSLCRGVKNNSPSGNSGHPVAEIWRLHWTFRVKWRQLSRFSGRVPNLLWPPSPNGSDICTSSHRQMVLLRQHRAQPAGSGNSPLPRCTRTAGWAESGLRHGSLTADQSANCTGEARSGRRRPVLQPWWPRSSG